MKIFFYCAGIISIGILLIACPAHNKNDNTHIKEVTELIAQSDADSIFFDFQDSCYNGTELIWKLKASKAFLYTTNNIQTLKLLECRFVLYKNGQESASLTSDTAVYDDKDKNVYASGNVVAVSEDGSTIYSDSLTLLRNQEKIVTDDYVEIIQEDGSKITGTGMETDYQAEEITIYNSRGSNPRGI